MNTAQISDWIRRSTHRWRQTWRKFYFAGRKADGFAEAKEFYQHRGLLRWAAARIKNGEELQTVLEEYESAIGIDYSQEIGVCSPEALGELCTLIADQASQKAPLFETIREQRVMACVNAAQVLGSIKTGGLGPGGRWGAIRG